MHLLFKKGVAAAAAVLLLLPFCAMLSAPCANAQEAAGLAAQPPAPPPPPPALPSWLITLLTASPPQLHDILVTAGCFQAHNLFPRVEDNVLANLGMRGQSMPAIPLAPLLTKHLGQEALDALVKAVQRDMEAGRSTTGRAAETNRMGGSSTDGLSPSFAGLAPDMPPLKQHQQQQQAAQKGDGSAPGAHVAPSTLYPSLQLLLAAPQKLNVSFTQVWELRYMKTWYVVAQARAIANGQGAADQHFAADGEGAGGLSEQQPGSQAGASDRNNGRAQTQGEGVPSGLEAEIRLLARLQARLPRRPCFPMLRRLVVGALAMRWARDQGTSWTAGVHHAVAVVLMQLYHAHRGAAVRKGIVELFHVSKAGGTSFCHLAFLNGCSTQDFSDKGNCLVREFDDMPRWVSRGVHFSLAPSDARAPWYVNYETLRNTVYCGRKRRFLQNKGWNMFSHEYTPVGGRTDASTLHLCPDHVSVLQAREPVARLVSHLKWIYGLYSRVEGANTGLYWPNTTSAHWLRMAPAVVDNYYIRSLLGEGAYHMPHGWVDEHSTHAAALIATQFDVLLHLEDTSASEYHMRMGLGWAHGLHDVHVRMDGAWAAAAGRMEDGEGDAGAAGGRLGGGEDKEGGGEGQLLDTRRQLLTAAGRSTKAAAAVQKAVHSRADGSTTGNGVPPDLATMVEWNKWDRQLYVYIAWLSRLDSVLFGLSHQLLGGNPAKGLDLNGPRVLPASNGSTVVPDATAIAERALSGDRRVSSVFAFLRQEAEVKAKAAVATARLKSQKQAAAALAQQAAHRPPPNLVLCGFAGVRAGA